MTSLMTFYLEDGYDRGTLKTEPDGVYDHSADGIKKMNAWLKMQKWLKTKATIDNRRKPSRTTYTPTKELHHIQAASSTIPSTAPATEQKATNSKQKISADFELDDFIDELNNYFESVGKIGFSEKSVLRSLSSIKFSELKKLKTIAQNSKDNKTEYLYKAYLGGVYDIMAWSKNKKLTSFCKRMIAEITIKATTDNLEPASWKKDMCMQAFYDYKPKTSFKI